jgi:hypothetical protein
VTKELFKTGPFAGFSVHDEFALAANRETSIVFDLGAISWPDRLGPTPLPLGHYQTGQKITGPINFKADVLILLYTQLETSAFLDVFTGNKDWSPSRRDTWYFYAHNFASLKKNIQGIDESDALKNGFFGYLNAVQIGDQKVVIYKTELHAKVNGNKLAIIPVIQQLVTELRPSLVLSTGTAGAMGSVLNCGDVAVTSSARFRVNTQYPTYPKINSLSHDNTALTNTVAINDKYLKYAAQNFTKLTLPALARCYAEFATRAGYAFLKKNTDPPSIYVTNINPVPGPEPMTVVSADFLSVDDRSDAEGLQALGIMNENDDAYAFFAISQMPASQQPQWLSVRNASDPQVVAPPFPAGTSQSQIIKQLSSLAGAIFGVYEYVTTINSAFACWAIVAGNATSSNSSHLSTKSAKEDTVATTIARIPITNVYGSGDYTAQLAVGSQGTLVNLILDTGSSTIAVKASAYDASSDTDLKPTPYAQEVEYGTGGWAGPLVTTTLLLGTGGQALTLQNAYLAIADDQLPNNFGAADGILGLAYNSLNQAYNLTTYLQEQNINPAVSYPWPFPIANSTAALAQLQSIFQASRYDDIPPYFDQVESQGLTANKFAFYTLRSFPSRSTASPGNDPLNNGFFILGGGEEQTDLYTGSFVNVDVLDDFWYNVNLISVQVGDGAPVAAAPLPSRFKQSQKSNAIIDSGTNSLFMATDVYKTILTGLNALNPQFLKQIQKAASQGIPTSQLKLSQWPNISLILTGEDGQPATLTVAPQTYWQVDFPTAGRAIFNIANGGMPQSILGLPLMNNYYTVFDRSQDAYGAIRFAPIKPL